MKEVLRQKAAVLGFDLCRVTTAQPPASRRQFQAWLDKGWHGEMGYLARNAAKRADPDLVLSKARSIITLAASYFPASQAGPPVEATASPRISPARGVVARYARFRDYHDVLGEKLRELAAWLDERGTNESKSLWYVDTGPLLERDLAQRAGLGFIGKHTNLISRQLGNWFFIGEIITPLELPPDTPETNRCGTCTRCITACPTQAITAPFQLDARRCISYLTIELKGPIPEPLRPAVGARIFGCDDCLEACPWNRFARAGRLMAPHARSDLDQPDLLELLALDDTAFRQRFQGTPLMRPKRRGLLRNVCVALGNIGTAQALPALSQAARNPEPLIAEHARWAIGRIQARMASG